MSNYNQTYSLNTSLFQLQTGFSRRQAIVLAKKITATTSDVYVQPKNVDLDTFEIGDDKILELNKPSRGLCEVRVCWGITWEGHIVNDLNMPPTAGNGALYFKKDEGK